MMVFLLLFIVFTSCRIELHTRVVEKGTILSRRAIHEDGMYVFHMKEDLAHDTKQEILSKLKIDHSKHYIHRNAYVASIKSENVNLLLENCDTLDYFLPSDKTRLKFGQASHEWDVKVIVQTQAELDLYETKKIKGVNSAKHRHNHLYELTLSSVEGFHAMEELAYDNNVLAIIPHLKRGTKNHEAANQVVGATTDLYVHALQERGLTGEGQIVGVFDTGVQSSNCLFWDESYGEIPLNQDIVGHRKLVHVAAYDESDWTHGPGDYDGHGTHTSGTILGKCNNPASEAARYNGIAEDAKLYFQDFYVLGYQEAFDAGAKIQSHSWGMWWSFSCGIEQTECVCYFDEDIDGYLTGDLVPDSYCQTNYGMSCCHVNGQYDYEAQFVDNHTYTNDEALSVFSAGNEGEWSFMGNVATPCSAKNSLCVGSSKTTNQHFKDIAKFRDFYYKYAELGWEPLWNYTNKCCESEIDHETKLRCCLSYIIANKFDPVEFKQDVLSYFSSRGPTPDGRLKPEIVAVGERVASSRSNMYTIDGKDYNIFDNVTYCGTGETMWNDDSAFLNARGTSMSCPVVSGLSTLVKEYLEKGYYPTYTANTNDEITPTGYLLKAMMINGAAHMLDHVIVNETSIHRSSWDWKGNEIASNYDGYGSVNEFDSYLFAGNTMFIKDRIPIYNGNETEVVCFGLTAATVKITVAMAYYDPPAAILSTKQLINQVNLLVKVLDCSSVECTLLETMYGNGAVDTLNPTEKVIYDESAVENFETTKICVGLHGENVVQNSPQMVAVVASPIQGAEVYCGSMMMSNLDVCGGVGMGQCRADGKCLCDFDTTLPECIEMGSGVSFKYSVLVLLGIVFLMLF